MSGAAELLGGRASYRLIICCIWGCSGRRRFGSLRLPRRAGSGRPPAGQSWWRRGSLRCDGAWSCRGSARSTGAVQEPRQCDLGRGGVVLRGVLPDDRDERFFGAPSDRATRAERALAAAERHLIAGFRVRSRRVLDEFAGDITDPHRRARANRLEGNIRYTIGEVDGGSGSCWTQPRRMHPSTFERRGTRCSTPSPPPTFPAH